MDDLYDNLDNYNEENTIAELQAENKELKCQLEVYAVSMAKLQKDFDKLSSGYKQLELNYSSLLKTARAEIERKTQIITNLNLEKDKMILKSYQKRNASDLYKSRNHFNPTAQQNHKKGLYEMTNDDDKLQQLDGKKSSPYSATERTDKQEPLSRDTTASPQTDLKSKLLNLAHGGQQQDSGTNAKENIMQTKKESDAMNPRASISDRRKSMPAISMETEQFSDDNIDLASNASSKNHQQTNAEHNFSEKNKHIDHNRERPRSRISETSSLEGKKGYHETVPDSNQQRFSRYDKDKGDKYRARHKSSHRYKRQSPDRYQSGSREYHDPYHRSAYDRHRGKGKMLGSPPRDKFYQRPSRELRRSNYEKNYPYEYERLLPRSQERYPTKRRIEQSYDEIENKKLRVESHSKNLDEDKRMELDSKRLKLESHSRHHDEDLRMKDERKPINKKYITDPLEIQFSSCESPDYDYLDVSNQQVKEIKLTATTKLDDPRISSKKYVLKKNDGQVILTTAIGRNVDIMPVRKIAWGITPLNMPEALKRPPELKQSAKDICREIDNPADISIESGEIIDVIGTQNNQKVKEKKVQSNERKETPIHTNKLEETKDIENSLKNIHNYKIPKTRKSVDDKKSSNNSKEITLTVNSYDNTSFKTNVSKNSDMAIKNFAVLKQQVNLAEEKNKPEGYIQDSFVIQSESQLSCLGTSNIYEQNHPTAKGVVENDLQMSDDNCDDHEQTDHVTKIPVLSIELKNKSFDEGKSSNTTTEKQNTEGTEKATSESCRDKTSTGETKKLRTKKKHKQRENKDVCKSEDSAKVFEKPAKKKEKEKETKITQIKTKFSELFDDSSSLISPEDLGLPSVPAPTTILPGKCVPFFEDALDADELSTVKSDVIKEFTHLQKTNVESTPHSDFRVTKTNTINLVSQEDSLDKSDNRSNDVTELTDDVIKSIYQNLEPGVPEEENVLKTVIISTGVQPPVLFEDVKQLLPDKAELQMKTIVGLKALATSTPQKIGQPEVVADIDSKILDSGCSSNNNSQIVSVDNTTTLEKSDTNTVDSRINDANVPDVRIFVKRRRKVTKK